MEHPKVSILCITYGHENYIVETLNGFLMQRYVGPVEIILSNDRSPDNTDQVIKDFLDKATIPANFEIKYTVHEQNLGMMPNFIWALQQCTGKYIAMCEGDDYWIDPLKLQKQVDFLEKNPDYVICFHKVNILKSSGELVEDFITKIPDKYEIRETLAKNSNYIHTPSVVFRNIVKDEINTIEFQNTPIGDYFLYLILAQHGKISFINEKMATYRHGVGVYSSKDINIKVNLELLLFINLYSFEKDDFYKKIYFKNILNSIQSLKYNTEKFSYNSKLMNTRRHIYVEKFYNVFKRNIIIKKFLK